MALLPGDVMRRIGWLPLLLLLPSCAHLGASPGERESDRLWNEAHAALSAERFARADSLFTRLAAEHSQSQPGRESLFYLGAIRLDPRNPGWDPQPAEASLRRYIATDSAAPPQLFRRPEALTLLELARQLNMPAEERVPGLQPETRVVRERVVVPARQSQAISAEAAELRRQVAERDATIRRLREELERIRKTLTGKQE